MLAAANPPVDLPSCPEKKPSKKILEDHFGGMAPTLLLCPKDPTNATKNHLKPQKNKKNIKNPPTTAAAKSISPSPWHSARPSASSTPPHRAPSFARRRHWHRRPPDAGRSPKRSWRSPVVLKADSGLSLAGFVFGMFSCLVVFSLVFWFFSFGRVFHFAGFHWLSFAWHFPLPLLRHLFSNLVGEAHVANLLGGGATTRGV